MNGKEFILLKQSKWAKRKNKTLFKHSPESKKETYFSTVVDNLFVPLTIEVQNQFNKADGGELKDSETGLAKMKALHSSSALAVNVFNYWLNKNMITEIAFCCGFCSKANKYDKNLVFEKNDLNIDPSRNKNPNIDIVINIPNSTSIKIFAIESKFTEPYYGSKELLKDAYFEIEKIWDNIPNIRNLVIEQKTATNTFKHLDVAQLVKHILCLNQNYKINEFKLVYLFYDTVGEEASIHHDEIKRFTQIVKADGIHFSSLSYQDLIFKLANNYYLGNEEYFDYVIDRYL